MDTGDKIKSMIQCSLRRGEGFVAVWVEMHLLLVCVCVCKYSDNFLQD